MLLRVINLLVFPVIPLVSTISLLASGRWMVVGWGAILIFVTVKVLGVLYTPQKLLSNSSSSVMASYVMPAYYLGFVIISASLSYLLINTQGIGDWRYFLFAYTCCYYPYNYLLGAEQALTGRISIMTNILNNFALEGYLLFGFLLNFTNVSEKIAYLVLFVLAIYPFYHRLPGRLSGKYI